MSVSFVPFFEKISSGEALPQYQFSQYKISKVKLSPPPPPAPPAAPPPPPPPSEPVEAELAEPQEELIAPELPLEEAESATNIEVSHVHKGISREELKTKVLSDLKNALRLSLPDEAIHQIVADLRRLRNAENAAANGENPEAEGVQEGEPPRIRLEREGDKVTNIVVECECGRMLTLDCIY